MLHTVDKKKEKTYFNHKIVPKTKTETTIELEIMSSFNFIKQF